MSARQRYRLVVAAVVVALSMSACTGGSDNPGRPDEATAGGAVIRRFADAWPDPEVANLRGVVDQPKAAANEIATHVAELSISGTRVTLLDDLSCSGESCRQHATVTHQLAGSGRWSYQTLISSGLDRGRWLVQWSPGTFNPDLTQLTTLVRRRTLPPRAPILDRSGVALTPERAIVRIGVQPDSVRAATYSGLTELPDIDIAALQDRVKAAQPRWFVPVIDLRRAAYIPLRDRLQQVPGVVIDTAKRALAPTVEWGRAVLGTVGPATSDSLTHAGPKVLPTDEVGVSGLQLAQQRTLAGKPGLTVDLVEKTSGDVLNHVLSRPPQPGQPLATTLDIRAQNVAEETVAAATDTTAVVVVKASTGEILAAANAPGPTSYNTAFVGRYAPGSTFKVVSAAALLDRGVVTPRRPVECPDTTVVDGKRFKNYEAGITGPNPTFADAFAASCNTTMVDFADDLSGK
ncbi:MAG: hypothetical protein H0V07_02185, partial [Propionibacteriales bacterium]|nr:hypothetical protein [Propionibacteriales bacterium]